MKRRDAQRRQDIETLQDVRSRLDFSVSRLNDVDTQHAAIEELREFMARLYPDWSRARLPAVSAVSPIGWRKSTALAHHLSIPWSCGRRLLDPKRCEHPSTTPPTPQNSIQSEALAKGYKSTARSIAGFLMNWMK